MKNTFSICQNRVQLSQQEKIPETINESRILEGRLVVNEDHVTGFVEVKMEELRSLITKYYTSTILSSMGNSTEFLDINKMYHFDSNPKYSVYVALLLFFYYRSQGFTPFVQGFMEIQFKYTSYLTANGSRLHLRIVL